MHVGEIVQLADTFLLTTRYPTEAVNPPSIKILPPVLKKSFRFILQSFSIVRCMKRQLSYIDERECTFYSLRSFPGLHPGLPIFHSFGVILSFSSAVLCEIIVSSVVKTSKSQLPLKTILIQKPVSFFCQNRGHKHSLNYLLQHPGLHLHP